MKPEVAFSANTAVEHRKEKDSQCHADPYSNYPVQVNTDTSVKHPFAWTGSLTTCVCTWWGGGNAYRKKGGKKNLKKSPNNFFLIYLFKAKVTKVCRVKRPPSPRNSFC